MSKIKDNHKALLRMVCSKTQSGIFGAPDLEDLEFVGSIHGLLEESENEQQETSS